MIRVTLVDDDLPDLKFMKLLLAEFNEIHIAGMYTSGEEAVDSIEEDKPDAVFLDIHMPGKNGLEIAKELSGRYPRMDIVFVTACDQYAIAAFEVSAVDYLLKPVKKERLEKTIKRLRRDSWNKFDKPDGSESGMEARIQCFSKFMVYSPSGAPLEWRTRKTKELMALFVHNRHRELTREKIIDCLWPEINADKAAVLFHTTMHNLKRALGALDGRVTLRKEGGGYRLYLLDIVCDVLEFEKRLGSAEQFHELTGTGFKELLDLYTGAYFEEDGYLWSEVKKLDFQSRLAKICMAVSLHYQERKAWGKAADALRLLLKVDDMNQAAYEMLVTLYGRLGNTVLMNKIFQRYKHMMDELSIPPKTLKELYEA